MNNTRMVLELSDEDVGVLKTALAIRLENLRFEVARTHDHDYRASLQHQLEHLEAIDRDLSKLRPGKQAA